MTNTVSKFILILFLILLQGCYYIYPSNHKVNSREYKRKIVMIDTVKKIVYIDMDGVLCNFETARDEGLAKNPSIKYPQSQYRFFADLEPMPDSLYFYKKLEEKFDVRILTAPSYMNLLCYTEKAEWVRKWLGLEAQSKMIIAPDKSIARGSYLIDDMTNAGQVEFGEYENQKHIHIGTEEFPDWFAVYEYLVEQK